MRDLESALDLEKNTKLEALAGTERLNNQLKYVEAKYIYLLKMCFIDYIYRKHSEILYNYYFFP